MKLALKGFRSMNLLEGEYVYGSKNFWQCAGRNIFFVIASRKKSLYGASEYFGRIKFHAGKLCVTTPRELALGSSFVTGDVDKVQGAPTGRID